MGNESYSHLGSKEDERDLLGRAYWKPSNIRIEDKLQVKEETKKDRGLALKALESDDSDLDIEEIPMVT